LNVIDGFSANLGTWGKDRSAWPQRRGQDHFNPIVDPQFTGFIDEADRHFALTAVPVRWGHESSCRYFGQEHTLEKDNDLTVIEWLAQWDTLAGQQELRGLLGQMLFSGDDVTKPIRALSGGERPRILFCRLMLQKAQFPGVRRTYQPLGFGVINALNISLQKFEGTVLLVTHDHDVIGRSGYALVVLRSRPHRRFQGTVRGLFVAAATQGGAGHRATIAACMLNDVSLQGGTKAPESPSCYG